MAKKYLDYDGLLYFWQKIKTTFALQSHNHTKSDITDFPTTMTPSSHTHGNIQNGGTLQTTDVGVANGDKLVITDASGSNKIARSSVAFDGSTENKALTPKGTWKEFNNYAHPTTTQHNAAAVKVGNDANGHVVLGDALKTSDLTNDSGFITTSDIPEGAAASTTTPKMDGAASTGSELAFARGDHVHPSDTSKVDTSVIGQANGICPLDANSKVDSSYLPSYVDDVIEAYARSGQTALSQNWLATGSATGTVITPETGKIYVLMADSGDYTANTQFRWSGTTYVKLADGGVSSITNAEIDTIVAA